MHMCGPAWKLATINVFYICIFHTELSLSITNDDLVVKEGDDLSITCVPSTATVGLEWEIPITASTTGAVVEYDEPLRHTVTIRNANIHHEGHYICRVAGDVLGEISSATAFVKVRESKNFNHQFSRIPY